MCNPAARLDRHTFPLRSVEGFEWLDVLGLLVCRKGRDRRAVHRPMIGLGVGRQAEFFWARHCRRFGPLVLGRRVVANAVVAESIVNYLVQFCKIAGCYWLHRFAFQIWRSAGASA